MKIEQLIFWIGLCCILLPGCEHELDYYMGEQEPRLTMNALLEAGATENRVFLSLSGKSVIKPVRQATLKLYLNGVCRETVEGGYRHQWDEEAQRLSCLLKTVLSPEDVVRLEVSAEQGKYQASAEVIMPSAPAVIEQVDTMVTKLWTGNSEFDAIQYKIRIRDLPDERNYYRLIIQNGIYYAERPPEGWIPSEVQTIYDQEEFVLSQGHHQTSGDEDYNPFQTNIPNIYQVFTDTYFEDRDYTLNVYTGYRPADDYWYDWDQHICGYARIRLLQITEEEYRYLRALTFLQSDDLENMEMLMEPVIVPSNVENGLGFVGASSEQYVQMEIMHRYPRK